MKIRLADLRTTSFGDTSVVLFLPVASSLLCTLGCIGNSSFAQQGRNREQFPSQLVCELGNVPPWYESQSSMLPDSRKLFQYANSGSVLSPFFLKASDRIQYGLGNCVLSFLANGSTGSCIF